MQLSEIVTFFLLTHSLDKFSYRTWILCNVTNAAIVPKFVHFKFEEEKENSKYCVETKSYHLKQRPF